jgi:transcriptional regulator with XRE-family HTH domain
MVSFWLDSREEKKWIGILTRKSFHPIDAHVGKRVRIRRKILSMSQTKLGDAIGLTFQQIQKYERGANRIGASRLFELSEVLDVPVSYFFDDLPADILTLSRGQQEPKPMPSDPLQEPVSLELVRAYAKIENPVTRKSLFNLAKALAKHSAVDL